jgi:hypothetical protein
MPSKPQHIPYKLPKKVYGTAAKGTISPDETEKLDKDRVRIIQQVAGVRLDYARRVSNTTLTALSAFASEQAKVPKRTMRKTIQLLCYIVTHSSDNIQFHSSAILVSFFNVSSSHIMESRREVSACWY